MSGLPNNPMDTALTIVPNAMKVKITSPIWVKFRLQPINASPLYSLNRSANIQITTGSIIIILVVLTPTPNNNQSLVFRGLPLIFPKIIAKSNIDNKTPHNNTAGPTVGPLVQSIHRLSGKFKVMLLFTLSLAKLIIGKDN